jgi:hypothetical protein
MRYLLEEIQHQLNLILAEIETLYALAFDIRIQIRVRIV